MTRFVLPVLVSVFAVALAATACGGSTSNDGGGSRLDKEIQDEIDRLNQCSTVDDCESVAFPGCSTSWIGAEGDRSTLDELLGKRRKEQGDVACPAICQCGVLRCEGGKCVASEGDCMTEPTDGRSVCL